MYDNKIYLELHKSGNGNPIIFSPMNCSNLCHAMMKCNDLYSDVKYNFFSTLLTVQNIIICVIFFVIAAFCISGLIIILKN